MNKKNSKKITMIIIIMIMVSLILGIMYITLSGDKIENIEGEKNTSTGSDIITNDIILKSNIGDSLTKLEIINHQLLYGREDILSVNCSKLSDIETNKYCLDEQNDINLVSLSESWEQVLNKGDEYIVSFDCNTIYSDIGKKYCIEHQVILSESK